MLEFIFRCALTAAVSVVWQELALCRHQPRVLFQMGGELGIRA